VNLSSEQLLQFFTELQGLVRAGVHLGPELDLHAGSDCRKVRLLWDRIVPALEQGKPLSEALRDQSPQIRGATLALIRAGEESGDLLGTLEVVAQAHRRRLRLERTLRLAAVYPVVILLFMMGIMLIFGHFIVPSLDNAYRMAGAPIYGGLQAGGDNQESPVFSSLMFSLCRWMASTPGRVSTALVALLLVWVATGGLWLRPAMQRHLFAWMPVIGNLVNLGALTRWCHTTGHLLQRRISLPSALALAELSLDLPRLQRESVAVRAQVDQGIALSMALMGRRLVPAAAAGLIAQGEQTGKADGTLLRLADHFEERLDYQIQRFEAWFEPALILFTALVVVAVVFNLYLPFMGLPRFL
jgi:type II secretory pathway component PulF